MIDDEQMVRKIVRKMLERSGHDVWNQRPEVSKWAKAKLLAGALAARWLG